MAAKSGISDKIQILEETAYGDGGAAGEVVFGVTRNFTWNVDTEVVQTFGLETGSATAAFNKDGVFRVTGTHEWEFTDGRELKSIMGSLPTNTGGNFTLGFTNTLPSYSAKVVDDDSDFLIIKGIKYSRVSIALTRNETVLITADWVAQTIEDESAFTPTASTIEPLTFLDGYFQLGSTKQTGIEDVSLEINRNVQTFRFIEDTTTNEKRLISAAIEGPANISLSGNQIAARSVIQEVWGSTSMTDSRSDKNIVLHLERGTVGVQLTVVGGRFTTVGRELAKDSEVSLMSFEGVGRDITGTGTYTT